MTSTLPQSSPLTPLDSIKATSAAIKAPLVAPLSGLEYGADVLRLLQRVHGELGVKQEYAAARCGVKPQQYSAALHGAGHFSVVWLFKQEIPFVLRFFELAMEHFGVNPASKQAARANRIAELVRLLLED